MYNVDPKLKIYRGAEDAAKIRRKSLFGQILDSIMLRLCDFGVLVLPTLSKKIVTPRGKFNGGVPP